MRLAMNGKDVIMEHERSGSMFWISLYHEDSDIGVSGIGSDFDALADELMEELEILVNE